MFDDSGFAHMLNFSMREDRLLRGKTSTCVEGFAE